MGTTAITVFPGNLGQAFEPESEPVGERRRGNLCFHKIISLLTVLFEKMRITCHYT
jgi:hypothetical protein